MGTRSTTYFLDSNKKPYASMYGQYDGYPTGMGYNIVEALKDRELVNGFSDPDTQLNGIHCTAAYLISKLKAGAGGVYLYGPDVEEAQFVYMLWVEDNQLMLSVKLSSHDRIYIRKLKEFDAELAEEYLYGEED